MTLSHEGNILRVQYVSVTYEQKLPILPVMSIFGCFLVPDIVRMLTQTGNINNTAITICTGMLHYLHSKNIYYQTVSKRDIIYFTLYDGDLVHSIVHSRVIVCVMLIATARNYCYGSIFPSSITTRGLRNLPPLKPPRFPMRLSQSENNEHLPLYY